MSDQMFCSKCDMAWDMNDPDPPACVGEFPEPFTIRASYSVSVSAITGHFPFEWRYLRQWSECIKAYRRFRSDQSILDKCVNGDIK